MELKHIESVTMNAEDIEAKQAEEQLYEARDGLVKALALYPRSASGYRAGMREKIERALEMTDEALDVLLQRGRPGTAWS